MNIGEMPGQIDASSVSFQICKAPATAEHACVQMMQAFNYEL